MRIGKLAGPLLAAALAFGCKGTAPVEARRYVLRGTVAAVDGRARQLVVSHEDVPGLMQAMTMGFNVREERVLAEIRPGDEIEATLVVADGRHWLENVRVKKRRAELGKAAGERAAATATDGTAETIRDPRPNDLLPDFRLVNQDGKTIRLSRYRGQTLVITFIYTRCPLPDYCPRMNRNFAEVEKLLRNSPELHRATHLLTISFDPGYDRPKVLRKYALQYADAGSNSVSNHWEWATGEPSEVKQIASFFGLAYWGEGDQIVHSLRTAIVSPEGRVVKIYHGNDWKPEQILADLRLPPIRNTE